jgi:hypothetical protein
MERLRSEKDPEGKRKKRETVKDLHRAWNDLLPHAVEEGWELSDE